MFLQWHYYYYSSHYLQLQNVFEAYKLGVKNRNTVKHILATTFFDYS